jgi:hypothetical protein
MNSYNVKFAIDDEGTTGPYVRTYKATNPGQAFQKCLKECPKARLIEAWREGQYLDGYGITTYRPPSMVKLEEAEPAPKEEQILLHFPEQTAQRIKRHLAALQPSRPHKPNRKETKHDSKPSISEPMAQGCRFSA